MTSERVDPTSFIFMETWGGAHTDLTFKAGRLHGRFSQIYICTGHRLAIILPLAMAIQVSITSVQLLLVKYSISAIDLNVILENNSVDAFSILMKFSSYLLSLLL